MAVSNLLQSIAQQVPVLNQQAAKRATAAQQVLAQQGLAKAQPQANVTRASQEVTPAIVQQQSAPQITAAQQTTEQLGAAGQQALQQQEVAGQQALQQSALAAETQLATSANKQALDLARAELASKKRMSASELNQAKQLNALGIDYDTNLSMMTVKQREDLAKLGRNIKQQIFDSRLQFDKDEQGRKFSNERQLAEWTMANAKSSQDFQTKMQNMERAAKRDLQLQGAAINSLKAALKRGYLSEKQKLDNESRAQIQEMINKAESDMKRKQARNANTKMIVGGAIMTSAIIPGIGVVAPAILASSGASIASSGAQ